MKVAVVTDSNSGITQAQAKEMGVYVLPMPFMIDGTEYLEDIDLTQKEFYEHLSGDHDVSTSQPSPETILNLWEKLLEEYDAVVHIPMSSGLSSFCCFASVSMCLTARKRIQRTFFYIKEKIMRLSWQLVSRVWRSAALRRSVSRRTPLPWGCRQAGMIQHGRSARLFLPCWQSVTCVEASTRPSAVL